jgi:hypothetical protein
MPKKGQYKSNAKERTKRERDYDGSKARKLARAERNRARQKAIREGKVSVGDSRSVDHKKPIATNGVKKARAGGTRVQSRTASNKQGSKVRSRKYG